MSGVIEALMLKLTGDSSGLRAELAKGSAAVDAMAKGVAKSTDSMEVSFASVHKKVIALAAVITTALTTGALASLINKSMEAIDSNAKLADRLGLTADEFAALKLSAELANTSVEAVTKSATVLRRAMSEAAAGSEEARAHFAALGLTAEQLRSMGIDQALGLVAGRLYQMSDASDRTATTMALLGRGSGELDAFLRDGSAGIAEATAQIDAMGGALTRVDAAEVEKANDAFTTLSATVQRIIDAFAAKLSPVLNVVWTEMTGFITETIKGFGGVDQIAYKVVSTILMIADAWVRTAQTIGGVLKNLGTLLIETAKTGQAGFEVSWAAITYAFNLMITEIGIGTSKMLHMTADVMTANGVKGANTFRELAFSISTSTGRAAADTKVAFESMKERAVVQAETMRAAFANILKVDASGSSSIGKMQDLLNTANAASGMKGPPKTPDQGADPAGEAAANLPISKEQQQKLDQIRTFLMSEAEIENAAYQEKMNALTVAHDSEFTSAGERNTLIQGVEAEHQRALGQIAADAADARKRLEDQKLKAQLSGASTFFSNMSSLMNTGSKRLFKIGQAAAIATTIVNTAQAAMAGFAVGMSNGGPYVAAAYAAAAIVAGAVQIANIRSASPGGGGNVGGGGGAGVPSSGGSDPNSPNVGVNGGGTFGASGQQVNITVIGSSVDKSALIALGEQLNALSNDGVHLGQVTFQ
jgi:hypothetical protein